MRKHIVSARIAPAMLTLSFALLAVACDRAGDESQSGQASLPTTVAAVPPSARTGAIGNRADEAMAPMAAQMEDAVSSRARVQAGTPARAASTDAHAVSLGSPLPPIDPTGAMLIRHGQASVEVKRVDDAVAKVRQVAAQFGGFVANTSLVAGRDEERSATLELRVPTAQFDALVSALGGLGKVESVSATVQDVGDEYVDLGARVANARRVEARLVEMVATRTGKLSEVLTVEQELRRVREEIERYEARLKWLERRTSLSSLDIALHEPRPLIDRQPGPGPLAEALAQAWTRAVAVLAWCIASLGIIVPLGLLITGMLLLARRLLRPSAPPGVSGA
jgi:hypothetical protein